nr:arabinofuranosidase [Williamsia phyllosphaerae]
MRDTSSVIRLRAACVTAVSTVVLVVAGLVIAPPAISGAAPSGLRYTVVGFETGNPRSMDVYESSDATTFTLARNGAYQPATGVVRDPSIFRSRDGVYHLTYTTGGAKIGFATSTDRINWTSTGDYPVPLCCAFLPGTGDGKGPSLPFPFTGSAGAKGGPSLSPFVTKAWAPDWFVEGDRVSVILSLSTGGGFVPYVMTALNSSLTRFSAPALMFGINADHIDTTVVKVGATYHAFTKNETKKIIDHAVAPTLNGPYRYVPAGNWGTLREGPAVTQLPNGNYRIYYDAYRENKYFYSDSSDGLRTFSPPKEVPGISGRVHHIGVLSEQVG